MRTAGSSATGRFNFALLECGEGGRGDITQGDCVAIVALEHGRARIRTDASWIELDERQCGLCVSTQAIEVLCLDGPSVRVSSCSVPRTAGTIIGDVSATRSVLHQMTSERISSLFRLGHDLASASSPTQLRLRDIIGEAIFQSFIAESSDVGDASMPQCVRRTRSHFDEHFSQSCDLASLASAAGVRKEHLVAAFRRHIGSTPIRYLWDVRKRHALHLVRTTQMTLVEIAIASGYKSHYHLSRELKRATGSTPRELRRGALANDRLPTGNGSEAETATRSTSLG